MHDWLGIGLITVGVGLIVFGVLKRQTRMRNPIPAGAIRPEFAAMGEMVRPIILFFVGVFALKITVFYCFFGGQRFLTPLDFAGLLFVLAAYSGWLVMATKRPVETPAHAPMFSRKRSAA